MADRTLDWRGDLGRWLKPFLARLGHKARRQMCPLYVSGLIGPGDRKSSRPGKCEVVTSHLSPSHLRHMRGESRIRHRRLHRRDEDAEIAEIYEEFEALQAA